MRVYYAVGSAISAGTAVIAPGTGWLAVDVALTALFGLIALMPKDNY